MSEPATESPIETQLDNAIRSHLHGRTSWHRQVSYRTDGGVFRVDFLASIDGRRVAIECDGKQFHDYRRDLRRDIYLLFSRSVHAVMRFPGGNIHHQVDHVVEWIEWYEPGLFDGSEWAPPRRIPDKVFRYSLISPIYRCFHHGDVLQHKNPYR